MNNIIEVKFVDTIIKWFLVLFEENVIGFFSADFRFYALHTLVFAQLYSQLNPYLFANIFFVRNRLTTVKS